VSRDSLAARYVAGELPAALLEEYELHFFECSVCYDELKLLMAVRQTLAETRTQRPETRRAWSAGMSGWRWTVIAAAAASAIGAVVLLRSHEVEPPVTIATTNGPEITRGAPAAPEPVAEQQASTTVTEPVAHPSDSHSTDRTGRSLRAQRLARLAHADPPRYSPSVLRGAYDEATLLFEDGMTSYAAADYAAAVPILRQAAKADTSRTDIAFFLAASELMERDFVAARSGFEGVLAHGETPFAQEAHYYLAKIALASNDIDQARTELGDVVAAGGPLATKANSMLAELRELERP